MIIFITNFNFTKLNVQINTLYFIQKRYYPLSSILLNKKLTFKSYLTTYIPYITNSFKQNKPFFVQQIRREINNNILETQSIFYVTTSGQISPKLQQLIKHSYFPSEHSKYLPKIYALKENANDFISGLMSLSRLEREKIIENSLLGNEVREIFLTALSKILVTTLLKNKTMGDLTSTESIDNIFSRIPIDLLKNNPELYKLITEKKIITILQHFVNTLVGPHKIASKYFVNYCRNNNMIYNNYDNEVVTMQQFVEAAIIKKVLLSNSLIENPFTRLILINPDKLPEEFSIVESRLDVGQNHADLLIRTCDTFYTEVRSLYCDVKTYTTTGIGRRTLSINQTMPYTDRQNLNNIYTALNTMVSTTGNLNAKKLYNIVSKIIKDRTLSLQEKSLQVHKIIYKAMFDPLYQDLKFSLAVSLADDANYLSFYKQDLIKTIKQEAAAVDSGKQLQKLFPQDYKMSAEDHFQIINYYIDVLFLEDTAKIMKENFLNILQST